MRLDKAPLAKALDCLLDGPVCATALGGNRINGRPALTPVVGEVGQTEQHHLFGKRQAGTPYLGHQRNAHRATSQNSCAGALVAVSGIKDIGAFLPR